MNVSLGKLTDHLLCMFLSAMPMSNALHTEERWTDLITVATEERVVADSDCARSRLPWFMSMVIFCAFACPAFYFFTFLLSFQNASTLAHLAHMASKQMLTEVCRTHGLLVAGNKDELWERLDA